MDARAAVFELDAPAAISSWRDSTYGILVDTLSTQAGIGKQLPHVTYKLTEFHGLHVFVRRPPGRLQLASETKPFIVAHYREMQIHLATESDVCVNHGSNYAMYDSTEVRWTHDLLGRVDVRDKCTFQSSPGPYQCLQNAVSGTTHTSNEVISRLAECAETLTDHEFYAFGVLRLGHRLQWRNIARELCASVLDLNYYEIDCLVRQAAWQACPLGGANVCRDAHMDLEEEEFGSFLLWAMDQTLATTEHNWQSAPTVCLLVALVARLLSLSTYCTVRERCLAFMKRAREISLSWTRQLTQRHREESDELFQQKALEIAVTCHGTFNVDNHLISDVLRSDEDLAILLECSTVIHDHCPTDAGDSPAPIKALLRRHWRLSHRFESQVHERILGGSSSLDMTIARVWPAYVPGHPWAATEAPHKRWLTTETSSNAQRSMKVQYNLLNGTLLVNGLPLNRLPSEYESHPTFRRLFGKVD